ncbi:MAG: phosphoribosylamine--glycine ligase [Chloroflexi bacterium]|nr:phosphoribosylamine--glycine ligase [Chloroflexota bacterium]
MKLLVVGTGAREHALVWKLRRDAPDAEVFATAGNAGLDSEAEPLPVSPTDVNALLDAARRRGVDLTVIGPEAPLAAGVADALSEARIAVFGPSAAAARIETSKAWCHEIAAAAGVPMARAGAFAEIDPAIAFARALDAEGRGIVVKADGLAGGKGVTVATDLDEAIAATRAVLAQPAAQVVIEERLSGREASCIAMCDGRDALALPIARDHKRLGDGDSGPNTGGMGAYSPLPDLPDEAADEIVQRFHRPILAELARRGSPFVGALYAGIMLTADGLRLLECNARLGDPETQVILPRLAAPLGPVLLAAARGRLLDTTRPWALDGARLPVVPGATVGVVLAAAGYPDRPRWGDPIGGLDAAAAGGALVFHAGTRHRPGNGYETAGGRVLTVVGAGVDVVTAHARAEAAADAIDFAGVQRRRDIGADPSSAVRLVAAGT